MAETRNCPECDTLMEYRLGEYECPSCGHVEAALQQKAESPRGTSGPGFRQPPASAAGGVTPGMPGTTFGNYQGSPLDPAPRQKDSGLELEKKGIMAFYLLHNVGILAWAYATPGSAFADRVGFMFLMVFPVALGLAVLYYILNTDQDWLRYTCMGCMGLGILVNIVTLVGPGAMNQMMVLTPAMQFTSALLNLGYAVWLISILYRDMQR